LLQKFLGPATYEFTTDGRTVVSVADRRTEGTYEIRRQEDDFMVLGLTDGDRVREVRVDFTGDGLIIEDNRRRIALTRR
jgi:Fe2+ transport system protein FeoA